jgi:hypothetical protein
MLNQVQRSRSARNHLLVMGATARQLAQDPVGVDFVLGTVVIATP